MIAELREAVAALAEVGCTGASDDERVAATVNAKGVLVGLEIDARVFRRPDSEALAAAVLQAVDRAREASLTQTTEAVREILGVDLNLHNSEMSDALGDTLLQLGRRLRAEAEGDA